MRLCVYQRVSTLDQSLDSQQHAIQQWLAAHPEFTQVVYFSDAAMSGKRDDRPQFLAMQQTIAAGQADAVLVYRLDRLSRNAVTALRLLLDWIVAGVGFYAVDQPVLSLGRENPMRLTVAAMFSEFAALEHEAIVARVKAGLRAAQARGVRLGARPKLTDQQRATARALYAAGATQAALATQFAVSPMTMSRVLRD